MTEGFDHNPAASKYTAKASNMMGLTAEMLAKCTALLVSNRMSSVLGRIV